MRWYWLFPNRAMLIVSSLLFLATSNAETPTCIDKISHEDALYKAASKGLKIAPISDEAKRKYIKKKQYSKAVSLARKLIAAGKFDVAAALLTQNKPSFVVFSKPEPNKYEANMAFADALALKADFARDSVKRQTCYGDAKNFLKHIRDLMEAELKVQPSPAQKKQAEPLPEDFLRRYYGYTIAYARAAMAEGDFHYRRVVVSPQSSTSKKRNGLSFVVLEYQRARQAITDAYALAENGNSAHVGIDLELKKREQWVLANLAFNGMAWGTIPEKNIGYSTDDGDTQFGDLRENYLQLEAAENALKTQLSKSMSTLVRSLKNATQLTVDKDIYREESMHRRVDEMMRIIEGRRARKAEGKEAEVSYKLKRAEFMAQALESEKAIEKQQEEKVKAAKVLLSEIKKELEELQTFGARMLPSIPAKSSRINSKTALSLVKVRMESLLKPCTNGVSEQQQPAFDKVWHETWSKLQSDKRNSLPKTFEGLLDELVNQPDSFGSMKSTFESFKQGVPGQRYNELEAARLQANNQCQRLVNQFHTELLRIEKAHKAVSLERVKLLAKQRANHMAAALQNAKQKLENTAEGDVEKVKEIMVAAVAESYKAARKRVVTEIEEVQKRINAVKDVVATVKTTGENIENALKAVQGLYTSLQAVPVGTGPGGVIMERDTLVAAKNAFMDSLLAGYQTYQDIQQLMGQVKALESSVRTYRDRLRDMDFKQELKQLKNQQKLIFKKSKSAIKKQMKESVEKMKAIGKQSYEDIKKALNIEESDLIGLANAELTAVHDDIESQRLKLVALDRKRARYREKVSYHQLVIVDKFSELQQLKKEYEELASEIQKKKDGASKTLNAIDTEFKHYIELLEKAEPFLATRLKGHWNYIQCKSNNRSEGVKCPQSPIEENFLALSDLNDLHLAKTDLLAGDVKQTFDEFVRARDLYNKTLFEVSNAAAYYGRHSVYLDYATHTVASAKEAKERQGNLVKRWQGRMRNAFNTEDTRLTALRISRDDLKEAYGIKGVRSKSTQLNIPACTPGCKNAATCSTNTTRYCLRLNLRSFNAQNAKLIQTVYKPAVVDVDKASEEQLPDVLETSDLTGTFLSMIKPARMPQDPATSGLYASTTLDYAIPVRSNTSPYVMTTKLTWPAKNITTQQRAAVGEHRFVGGSRMSCGGDLGKTMPMVEFGDNAGKLRGAEGLIAPGNVVNVLKHTALFKAEDVFARSSKLTMLGRGLDGVIEIEVNTSQKGTIDVEQFPENMYLIMFDKRVQCEGGGVVEAAPANHFKQGTLAYLMDSLEKNDQGIALGLVNLEHQMAEHARAPSGTGQSNVSTAYLELMEALYTRDPKTPLGKSDESALRYLSTDKNMNQLVEQLTVVNSQSIGAKVDQLVNDYVQDVMLDRASGGPALGRPPAFHHYERITRYLITGQSSQSLDGSEPEHNGRLVSSLHSYVNDLDKVIPIFAELETYLNAISADVVGIDDLARAVRARVEYFSSLEKQLSKRKETDPYVSLSALLCTQRLMADPAFWSLQSDSTFMVSEKEKNGLGIAIRMAGVAQGLFNFGGKAVAATQTFDEKTDKKWAEECKSVLGNGSEKYFANMRARRKILESLRVLSIETNH